ncbi:MAG: bifunctional riboflavin kinase/FAD synthetase [Prevotella sp.]|nr:bifunctional riboflavin kinase/FAD synthetase [Prevotella sp.]
MRTIFTDNGYNQAAPCVATIGFFDGVHSGHKYLIKNVLDCAADAGMQSMVISFERHPQYVICDDYRPKLLTTNEEKSRLLSLTGIDNCVLLHFDRDMAMLSAREFMQTVLRDKLNVKKLIIGYNNHFGHDRKEGFREYAAYGRELGIEVLLSDAFNIEGNKVSSSIIRSFLADGNVEDARRCLSYPYFIHGTVVQGVHEGRKMGFPTANMCVNDELKLIPKNGAYAVKAMIGGSPKVWDAMMNIGTRPTFGDNTVSLETHIFGFDGNIYGKRINIRFMNRLRDEQKFSSVNELAAQLRLDMLEVKRLFAK